MVLIIKNYLVGLIGVKINTTMKERNLIIDFLIQFETDELIIGSLIFIVSLIIFLWRITKPTKIVNNPLFLDENKENKKNYKPTVNNSLLLNKAENKENKSYPENYKQYNNKLNKF